MLDLNLIAAKLDYTTPMETLIQSLFDEVMREDMAYEYSNHAVMDIEGQQITIQYVTEHTYGDGGCLVVFPTMQKFKQYHSWDDFVCRIIDLGYAIWLTDADGNIFTSLNEAYKSMDERHAASLRW